MTAKYEEEDTAERNNPWECEDEYEGFVPLPEEYGRGRELYARVRGPRREGRGETPVVLFFTGGGAPCEVYVRLLREMGRSWRVLVVEREGYGRSIRGDDTGEEGTSSSWVCGFETRGNRRRRGKQIMARDSAEELSALLRVMGVKGPYVLVAHSYGAIVAREFLDVQGVRRAPSLAWSTEEEHLVHQEWDDCSRPLPSSGPKEDLDKVVGLALIEPASELLYQTHKPVIPPPAFDAVLKGVDVDKVTRLREESGMTDAEWDDAIRGIEKTAPGAALEECRASGRILADKHQLTRHVMSPWPVAVLRCNWAVELQKLFDAGVEAGNGSDEERKQVREFLWAWRAFDDEVRAGLVRLTGQRRNFDSGEKDGYDGEDMAEGGVTRRYTYFEECGHDVPSRRPDVVIQEVGWVMDTVGEMEATT